MSNNLQDWLTSFYVVFAFCAALCLGALKSLLVGPIAGLILIIGNVGVILGLFPAHVLWTVYALVKTNRFDAPLKVAFLFALPVLFGIWLGLVRCATESCVLVCLAGFIWYMAGLEHSWQCSCGSWLWILHAMGFGF